MFPPCLRFPAVLWVSPLVVFVPFVAVFGMRRDGEYSLPLAHEYPPVSYSDPEHRSETETTARQLQHGHCWRPEGEWMGLGDGARWSST